jgi:hypothetical protein
MTNDWHVFDLRQNHATGRCNINYHKPYGGTAFATVLNEAQTKLEYGYQTF